MEEQGMINNMQQHIYSNTDDLMNYLFNLIRSRNYVFRGYSKQDELLPQLIRDGNKQLIKDEVKLLRYFEKYAASYFSATTPIDFWSYAQHFGIATRLVDFTFNPFVALAFSINSPKATNYLYPQDKDYYYIKVASIEDNIMIDGFTITAPTIVGGSIMPESLASRAEIIINCLNQDNSEAYSIREMNENLPLINSGKILFINPGESNPRIVMQQGLFMIPYDLNKERHKEIINNNTLTILIDKRLRSELQILLDTMGFNTFRLMPDISSVCKAVTQKVKNEKYKQEREIHDYV